MLIVIGVYTEQHLRYSSLFPRVFMVFVELPSFDSFGEVEDTGLSSFIHISETH